MNRTTVAIFLLMTCVIYPQTYYLNVWSNGKAVSIPVQEIRKLTFSGVTGVNETGDENIVIKSFQLFQNYPNPFNPTTQIEYQIPSEGYVTIQIFNINGELVRTLMNMNQPAGKYTVLWDGRGDNSKPAASGIYIYRITNGNSVLSKKMLLLK